MTPVDHLVLPPVPEGATARQRLAQSGQGCVDTLRQYAGRARDAGCDDIADEFEVLFSRAFLVLRKAVVGESWREEATVGLQADGGE